MIIGWKERIEAVFIPQRCLFCDDVILCGTSLCPKCRAACRPHLSPHPGNDVLDGFFSVYPHAGSARERVLELKFRQQPEHAVPMGRLMWEFSQKILKGWGADMVSYIPMHPEDRRERGYNQGRLLADSFATQAGLPVKALLRKTLRTKKQHDLSGEERSRNLKEAYALREGAAVEGKAVLLIDDVITTGSTVRECAALLKSHGAKRVWALSFTEGGEQQNEEEGR